MKKYYLQDFLWGIPRGINFHWHTMRHRDMKPTIIEFKATAKCNARCIMCNIWKSRSEADLTLAEFKTVFASTVLSEVRKVIVSGGEPFLRKDFDQLIHIVNTSLPSLREITIKTNGLRSDDITRQVRHILKIIGDDVRLHIAISFDGIGADHDRTRNIEGAHEAAIRTVKSLQDIKDERIEVHANIAIGPYNVDHLAEMHQYFLRLLDKVAWFPVIVSDRNFMNDEKTENLVLDSDVKRKMVEFFRYLMRDGSPVSNIYYYRKLIDIFENGVRDFPCTGGYRYMHIDLEGNISACPFAPLEYAFGNIKQGALEELWASKESCAVRKKLKQNSMCRNCTSVVDLFSLVREEYFDFIYFLLTHPKILFSKVRNHFK